MNMVIITVTKKLVKELVSGLWKKMILKKNIVVLLVMAQECIKVMIARSVMEWGKLGR